MAIDTFLFDLDGTLVDSSGDLAAAVNLLRAELDLAPLTLTEVREKVGDGATKLVMRSLPEGSYRPHHLQRFLALYGDHLLDTTALYPGIDDFLRARAHHAMAVVTNKPERLARDLIEGLGLENYFPVILGGDSLPVKKPEPEPLLRALSLLHRTPESAVMVGDHHTDLEAGRRAGIRTCFCAWGIGHHGGLRADFVCEQPAGLMNLFPPTSP